MSSKHKLPTSSRSSKRTRTAAPPPGFFSEKKGDSFEDLEIIDGDAKAAAYLPRIATIDMTDINESSPAKGEHTVVAARPRDPVSSFFTSEDYSHLPLKPDHASRPLWVCPISGHILLEAFSPISEQAQDFLTTIAEPLSRPAHVHEYKLTAFSLYAAVSVGMETKAIIEVLNRLSKIPIPGNLVRLIEQCTLSYGKVKLVLKRNRYYLESTHPDILQRLLKDPIILESRVVPQTSGDSGGSSSSSLMNRERAPTAKDLHIAGSTAIKGKGEPNVIGPKGEGQGNQGAGREEREEEEEEEEEEDSVHTFEISTKSVEGVKRRCIELDFPTLEEYDFRNDTHNANLDIDLKPITVIRPYQERCLSKMFGNGRARSGIIVLPCGAGKTLVGITAACTIKKSTLVLCTSSVSVMQWKEQFLMWSNIKERQIAVFTSDQKERFAGDAGVVVSTYSMVANTRHRSYESEQFMRFLRSREWGFLLLDEVHVVPAQMFRQVIITVPTHAKLGLTATLVREDEKIDDLNFLIGPKLYEANWMDLAARGHIANVQCAEVWCPMSPEFFAEYLRQKARTRALLYVMNPKKAQACQYLIRYHEERGDKIIVFSDNVYALKEYAYLLKKPFICGETGQQERMRILKHFQHNPAVNTIFLSKVGDTSIDLPEATCLIQISSHYGSRRQEAQRLGRILRAKRRNDEGFNAFFYSLVSKDTQEMYYSTKRQQFLVDQGYAFKVITHLEGMESMEGLHYADSRARLEYLQSVLMAAERDDVLDEDVLGDGSDEEGAMGGGPGGMGRLAKRTKGSMKSLSGADSMAFAEQDRFGGRRDGPGGGKERNKLFQQLEKRKRAAAREEELSG